MGKWEEQEGIRVRLVIQEDTGILRKSEKGKLKKLTEIPERKGRGRVREFTKQAGSKEIHLR